MPKSRSLDGCDAIIDHWLGLDHQGRKPQYKQTGNCRSLGGLANALDRLANADGKTLVSNLLQQIENNWTLARRTRDQNPSRENWRFSKIPITTPKNRPEVTLERRIIGDTVTDQTWANQIPTCSGLVNSYTDRRRAIDLARQENKDAELIELKLAWGSGTPLMAAFEILGYGLLYYFSRCHMQELGYSVEQKPLLSANTVSLIVLAPDSYYDGVNFGWLEVALKKGLLALSQTPLTPPVQMRFRFERFPQEFDCDDTDKQLKQSLANRQRVYGS